MFVSPSPSLPILLGTTFCLLSLLHSGVSQSIIDQVCNSAIEFSEIAFPVPQTCIDVTYPSGAQEIRCYHVYTPTSCSMEEQKVPVVLDVHGLSLCPYVHTLVSGWLEKAEEECFVVVFPNGNIPELNADIAKSCWKVPGGESTDGTDVTTAPCCCENPMGMPSVGNDAYFIKAVIDSVLKTFEHPTLKLDADRVYMAGHSNGCMASLSVAAQFSDTIAAVCCHAGALLTPFPSDYTPVPIWLAHGVLDPLINYDGETAYELNGQKFGYWSIPETAKYLGEVNQCDDEIKESDVLVEEVSIGKVLKPKGCKKGGKVEVLVLDESGHVPYKLPDNVDPAVLAYLAETGEQPTTYDTTTKAWEFCSAHKRKKGKKEKKGKKDKKNKRL